MAKLFRDIEKVGRVDKVKCIFCSSEIIKNGTRTAKHVAECKKWDALVEGKYLTEDENVAAELDQSASTEPVAEGPQAAGASQQPSIDSFLWSSQESRCVTPMESHSGSVITSTLAKPQPTRRSASVTSVTSQRFLFSPQENKINPYMDRMSETEIVSYLYSYKLIIIIYIG